MTVQQNAENILKEDFFSQWMGVRLIEIREHYCKIEIPIRKEMSNGIGTVHGGVTFAFAESALAYSCLPLGETCVALNCAINFTKAVKLGDVLTAESELIANMKKTAVYDIKVSNQENKLVASFRGTVYKLEKKLND